MKLAEYKRTLQAPLRQATLCFIIDYGSVLLGMKKRGFAKGRWNGFGGKRNDNEKIIEAAIRETREEAGITPGLLTQMAVLDFYFPHQPDWNQQVVTYSTSQWKGTPTETEEMKPQGFPIDEIPHQDMWVDHNHWLPLVLEGKKVRGHFLFKKGDKLLDREIVTVDGFK